MQLGGRSGKRIIPNTIYIKEDITTKCLYFFYSNRAQMLYLGSTRNEGGPPLHCHYIAIGVSIQPKDSYCSFPTECLL